MHILFSLSFFSIIVITGLSNALAQPYSIIVPIDIFSAPSKLNKIASERLTFHISLEVNPASLARI